MECAYLAGVLARMLHRTLVNQQHHPPARPSWRGFVSLDNVEQDSPVNYTALSVFAE